MVEPRSYFLFCGACRSAFVTDYFDDARQNRNHNNPDDQQLKVILNHRDCTEEIACVGKKQYPQQCADHVISGEMTVRHVAHSRNKRGERSDDRHKTGENNRFAAMFLIKLMGFVEITATEISNWDY